MPRYNWKTSVPNWWDRFPTWANGVSVWANPGNMPTPSLLEDLAKLRLVTPPKSRACLFVSHRQVDKDQALRIAWIADAEGYDFWLDVLDPALAGLASGTASSPQVQGAATAAVIEMGLLNSTHLIAVMTPKTPGSQWVPYEYGRVKEPAVVAIQSACYRDSSLPSHSLPEYMYLGPIRLSETDIRSWLRACQPSGMALGPAGNWTEPIPPQL